MKYKKSYATIGAYIVNKQFLYKKNYFLNFVKICLFTELLTFFYISSSEFSVTLKRNHAKTNGDRNEVLFAHKLAGSRKNFAGKIFQRKHALITTYDHFKI